MLSVAGRWNVQPQTALELCKAAKIAGHHHWTAPSSRGFHEKAFWIKPPQWLRSRDGRRQLHTSPLVGCQVRDGGASEAVT